MRVGLILPEVKVCPSSGPGECPYCHAQSSTFTRRCPSENQVYLARVIDAQIDQVQVLRYMYTGCGRSFRHYPEGVSRKQQTRRLQVVAAILWGLGLSLASASQVLEIFRAGTQYTWHGSRENHGLAECARGGASLAG